MKKKEKNMKASDIPCKISKQNFYESPDISKKIYFLKIFSDFKHQTRVIKEKYFNV